MSALNLEVTTPDGAARLTATPLKGKTKPFVRIFVPPDATTPIAADSIDVYASTARARILAMLPEAVRENAGMALVHLAGLLASQFVDPPSTDAAVRAVTSVEPWPDPVDPRDVLNELRTQIERHVYLPEHGDVVLALWIAHTHLMTAFDFTPYLWLSSPVRGCGKTTVLELCGLLTRAPLAVSNLTASALFRVIEAENPTVLFDEIDTQLVGPKAEDVANILNSRWQRSGAAIRCVGDEHEVKIFKTYCAKALAGIGRSLMDATRARCINLPMERASAEVQARLVQLRTDRAKQWAAPIAQRLARMAADNADDMRGILGTHDAIVIPTGVDGRDAQAWEPLLAVADLAGGWWSEAARRACLALVTGRKQDDDGDQKTRLLRDVRDFFSQHQTEKATSNELCEWLNADELRGWSEASHGKPLTAAKLASLLKPFKVRPEQSRVPGGKGRFWFRADLTAVFVRYLPAETVVPGVPPVPGVPIVPGPADEEVKVGGVDNQPPVLRLAIHHQTHCGPGLQSDAPFPDYCEDAA